MTKTIEKHIPAIYAEQPDTDKVSGQYVFIPTQRVITDLDTFGWRPRIMSGSDKNPAAKHMIRFARTGFSGREDVQPEIVLLNSHDGLSSFRLKAGIFRFVCSNGLIVATSVFDDIRIKHIHYSLPEVSKAVETFAGGIEGIMESVDTMKRTILSDGICRSFAEDAVRARWEIQPAWPVDISRLLRARRQEDRDSSVWSVMNILQEKLLKGDVYTVRGTKLRGLSQVDSVVGLNQELYALGMKYATN